MLGKNISLDIQKEPIEIKSTSINFYTQVAHEQENSLKETISLVMKTLIDKYPTLEFELKPRLLLKEIACVINALENSSSFSSNFESTFISPDGGILFVIDPNNKTKKYPILISEIKTQGSNSLAKGNAIERLGKNVIAIRSFLAKDQIMPFVVFCAGKDFSNQSTIIDRLSTIAQFAPLNQINLFNHTFVSPGSYFYKEGNWSVSDMFKICYEIAKRSLMFFASKYNFEI
ncbi:Type II restriction modification system endonuclease [Metamycoplasma auris 15026]|uniref:Type II restriction modification system endonuclease n=1 Tax=Metamycoplasma auris 15026 TaxID=1188233 RepID=N9V174_9BACT|nr:EcoRI family type II restriction endonuclease [Metamycoplasma auris]ENY69142.1 Type II restriction modification system endonuclease [Metamycoplasma auris 15026]